MAGRKGRSGRRPVPVALHVARGTYRRDRHGPLPAPAPVSAPPLPVGAPAWLADLKPAGRELATSLLAEFQGWSSQELAVLRVAAEARDRQAQMSSIIDAEGLVRRGRSGAPVAHPLIRHERAAGQQVVAALRQLDFVDQAPTSSARRA